MAEKRKFITGEKRFATIDEMFDMLPDLVVQKRIKVLYVLDLVGFGFMVNPTVVPEFLEILEELTRTTEGRVKWKAKEIENDTTRIVFYLE